MMLALFVIAVLGIAGVFAFNHGEGLTFLAVIAVLGIALTVAAPAVVTATASFQDALNTAIPAVTVR